MPHVLGDFKFFRSHSSSFDVKEPKVASSKLSNSRPSNERTPSSSGSSLASNDYAVMPDNHKRLSFATKSPKISSHKVSTSHATTLSALIESPPLVFYGYANSSSGALLSGQLLVQVKEDHIDIEKFKMQLVVEVTRKRPFHSHCADCAKNTDKVKEWDFLTEPVAMRQGKTFKHTSPRII